MSQNLIEQLTPEQEALISVYREKWLQIALSTEPIKPQKATEVLKTAYAAIGKQEPEILFVVPGWIGEFHQRNFMYKPRNGWLYPT